MQERTHVSPACKLIECCMNRLSLYSFRCRERRKSCCEKGYNISIVKILNKILPYSILILIQFHMEKWEPVKDSVWDD